MALSKEVLEIYHGASCQLMIDSNVPSAHLRFGVIVALCLLPVAFCDLMSAPLVGFLSFFKYLYMFSSFLLPFLIPCKGGIHFFEIINLLSQPCLFLSH